MATAIAPAPSSTGMTLEQYLHTSFSPDVDFIEGETKERNVGEFEHGRLQGLIFAWFLNRERAFAVTAVIEQRIRVTDIKVRICDVVLLRKETPREPVAVTPPFICIEIMSPEDRVSRAIEVLKDYRTMGVPHIWLVNPQEKLAFVFDENGLKQQEDLILRAAGTDIALDVKALFGELDGNENEGK